MTFQTVSALHASALLPPHPDAIAGLQVGDLGADFHHFSDHLMAGHQGISRDIPIVVDHVNVGVTNATGHYFDGTVKRLQRCGLKAKGLKRGTFFKGRKSINLHNLRAIER